MQKHAICPQSDTLSFDITTRITVNTTGKYEMQGLCDDPATFYIDGNIVLTVPKVLTFPSAEIALTSGDHMLRIVGVNLGGPAGVALTITHDDASPAFTIPAKQSLSGIASYSWTSGTAGNCQSTILGYNYATKEVAQRACESYGDKCTAVYILNNDIQIRGCSLEHQSIGWCCPGSECHCNVAQGGRTYFKNKISISSSDGSTNRH
jgi:hypothetical protein